MPMQLLPPGGESPRDELARLLGQLLASRWHQEKTAVHPCGISEDLTKCMPRNSESSSGDPGLPTHDSSTGPSQTLEK